MAGALTGRYWSLYLARHCIARGGVLAYPTEAVWGLGCDPWNLPATRRLLALKQRPMHKGLILIAADIEQFHFLLHDCPDDWLQILRHSWPGPNTWLLPHQGRVPRWITGNHDSVALRVTAHPLVQALCNLTGPLVSTSANPAGRPAARSRLRLEQYFHRQLDGFLPGTLGDSSSPSRIRDLCSGELVRA